MDRFYQVSPDNKSNSRNATYEYLPINPKDPFGYLNAYSNTHSLSQTSLLSDKQNQKTPKISTRSSHLPNLSKSKQNFDSYIEAPNSNPLPNSPLENRRALQMKSLSSCFNSVSREKLQTMSMVTPPSLFASLVFLPNP